jgi:hypothetical protein
VQLIRSWVASLLSLAGQGRVSQFYHLSILPSSISILSMPQIFPLKLRAIPSLFWWRHYRWPSAGGLEGSTKPSWLQQAKQRSCTLRPLSVAQIGPVSLMYIYLVITHVCHIRLYVYWLLTTENKLRTILQPRSTSSLYLKKKKIKIPRHGAHKSTSRTTFG